jgi:hypothetical protein
MFHHQHLLTFTQTQKLDIYTITKNLETTYIEMITQKFKHTINKKEHNTPKNQKNTTKQ